MEPLVNWLSDSLSRRASRRQVFKLMGGGALGSALALLGGSASAAELLSCSGCPGGPCNPCVAGNPTNCDNTTMKCHDFCFGGGCPTGCSTGGEWFCCVSGCRWRCSECTCPSFCCHCFGPIGTKCGALQCPC